MNNAARNIDVGYCLERDIKVNSRSVVNLAPARGLCVEILTPIQD